MPRRSAARSRTSPASTARMSRLKPRRSRSRPRPAIRYRWPKTWSPICARRRSSLNCAPERESPMTTVRPFLMFQGRAEEALDFYSTLFAEAEVGEIERYGEGEPGKPGAIKRATFAIGDQTIMLLDSPVRHDFTFTPAFSLFVECDSEEQIGWL